MTHQRTAERDAIASLERADPVDLEELADELDLAAAHDRVRHIIAADGRPSARPRRAGPGIRLGGAVALAAAVAVVAVVLLSGTSPEVQSASAMTIKRAAQALQARPGTILHFDFTAMSSWSDGHSRSWSQETWQQQGGAGDVVTLGGDRAGGPTGTESATINGIDEVYDPGRNTVYVDSTDPAAGARARLPSGALVRVPAAASVLTLADELRRQLASGQARVDGHATINGQDTIKIVLAYITYYVAADGSYTPVEQVEGVTPTGKGGTTTMVYHAYQQLPAAGNGDLLSLTARHPTATLENSPAGYRAAIARLFPDR